MYKYFFKKLFISFLSLFIMMSATFFFMKLIPGDPFLSFDNVPKEIIASLQKHYGLDKPLYIQYFKYIKGFLTFDLGPSYIFEGRTVNMIIKDGLPLSLLLGVEALFLSLTIGVPLGSIAALKREKWQDSFVIFIAILGISIPNFLLASLLQYLFAIKLKLLPIARFTSFFHSILPSISLAALPIAYIARLTRSSMIDVLSKDYVKTAKAKGLSPTKVILKHALKNASLPVIAYLGPISAHLLTGSFVIEKIFAIPGIGQWLVSSILNRDYTVIMGLSVFFSFILIVIMFFLDIIYRLVDPRIDNGYAKN